MSHDSHLSDDTGKRIAARAQELQSPMIAFLRDIVAARGLSGQEEACVRRVAREMEAVGFDEVRIDPLGNVLGRIISMEMVIDIGLKGFHKDLIAGSLNMLKQDLANKLSSWSFSNKTVVTVDYAEQSNWRNFVGI